MKLAFVEMAGFRGFRDKTRFDIPSGFLILSGRNGSGKSTLLDAIDFAITGTINKFAVKEARGGGLEEHIWWVGDGKPEAHYVSVGFIDDDGKQFAITRSRQRGADQPVEEILKRLCSRVADAMRMLDSIVPPLPAGLIERIEATRKLLAERRLALRDIEKARLLAEEVQPELAFFNSPDALKEIEQAKAAQEAAVKAKAAADERLALAVQLDEAERANDAFATHMAAIIEHGSALGLHDGHCPLCEALRTPEQFNNAISASRTLLADRGVKLAQAAEAVTKARATVSEAERSLMIAEGRASAIQIRRAALDRKLKEITDTYARYKFDAPINDPKLAQTKLFTEREQLVQLERALSMLEASNAIDRVKTLESRTVALRERSDQEAAKLVAADKALEAAHQIDNSAKTVANEILTEQFDTVMPLLKELYRRLRPHANWAEIESDFGGKIRGSLNFTVGDGYNPQFLFSSGQRRAAGLAFLLAVHLSRPWCRWRSLLMDDPVQHIDDYRALNLVEVLTAIRRTGRQVIVAVEDISLANVLCRRLRSSTNDSGRHVELRTSATGTAEIVDVQDIYPMPRLVLRPARAS
jgi:DNA repair exonuclease SbcCD ATPase subunit